MAETARDSRSLGRRERRGPEQRDEERRGEQALAEKIEHASEPRARACEKRPESLRLLYERRSSPLAVGRRRREPRSTLDVGPMRLGA
jgi:hypothetical protein